MNGRVYDPTLGRFLSADPHIQSPYSTQNYNRYSYVHNNPLKYTDPSGYFLGKLFKAIGKLVKSVVKVVKKYWRPILAIAAAYFVGTWALETLGWNAVQAGALGGFVGGVVSTGSLEGGIKGAITGAMFGYVGDQAFSQLWQKALAHGAVGGISAKLQGGKFIHGFISASVATYGRSMDWFKKIKEGVGKHIASGIIGGTAAALGGGKFGNGARTSAIQYLFNEIITGNVTNGDGPPKTKVVLRTEKGRTYHVKVYDVACFNPIHCGESLLVKGDPMNVAYLEATGTAVVEDINTLSGEVATWGATSPLGPPAMAVNSYTGYLLDDGYGLFANAFGFATSRFAHAYGGMNKFWSEVSGAYTGRMVSEASKE